MTLRCVRVSYFAGGDTRVGLGLPCGTCRAFPATHARSLRLRRPDQFGHAECPVRPAKLVERFPQRVLSQEGMLVLHRVFPAHYGEKRTISEGYWNFYSLCSHYKISL